jgi:YVTN family beta-propeller protein/probable HAF family extracellular repeat protein
VANLRSNDISVIDVATNQVEATRLPAGPRPSDVRITPDGQYLYVTNELQTGGTVSVIQVSTGALIQTISGLGNSPAALAISPSGKFIYVTNAGSGTVSIINTVTNQVSPTSINVGPDPEVIAFTPDGRFAYIGNYSSNGISFVSSATNQSVGSLTNLGQAPGPDGISITPDGKKAYVENYGNNGSGTTVSVIQTYMPKVVKTITVGPGPSQSAITPDGNYLFVPLQGANSGPPTSNSVVVIDTRTDTVIGRPILVGNAPGNVAITPDGKYAYVANADDNAVSVIAVAGATGPFYTFADLGTLGGESSYASALNNNGLIVGTAQAIKGNYAFRYAHGIRQNLGVLSTDKEDFSSAQAVNDAGVAVGYCPVNNLTAKAVNHACIFANGNVTDIGTPGLISYASGINDQSWIVGNSQFGNVAFHAFLFRPGDSAPEDLGTLGGTNAGAISIDNYGLIAGQSQNAAGNYVPFFAFAGGSKISLIALPTLGGKLGIAHATAEPIGDIVAVGGSVVSAYGPGHAVKWSLATKGYPITDLGTLPGGDNSEANSVNSTEQIVGVSSGSSIVAFVHAFIVENGLMRDLNDLTDGLPSGCVLTEATGINDYGQICGYATLSPYGFNHGFMLSPTRPSIRVGKVGGRPYENGYFLNQVNYSHFRPLTDSAVVSGEQPTASILYGQTGAKRQILATFSFPSNSAGFAVTPTSDRFTIEGTDGDMYVLQESFNPKDPYVVATGIPNMRLLWLNPATQSLENAVTGNTGSTNRPFFKLGAFDAETDFHLGTYGVDPLRNVVWAVINHD